MTLSCLCMQLDVLNNLAAWHRKHEGTARNAGANI
jgi:hypothetical protein